MSSTAINMSSITEGAAKLANNLKPLFNNAGQAIVQAGKFFGPVAAGAGFVLLPGIALVLKSEEKPAAKSADDSAPTSTKTALLATGLTGLALAAAAFAYFYFQARIEMAKKIASLFATGAGIGGAALAPTSLILAGTGRASSTSAALLAAVGGIAIAALTVHFYPASFLILREGLKVLA